MIGETRDEQLYRELDRDAMWGAWPRSGGEVRTKMSDDYYKLRRLEIDLEAKRTQARTLEQDIADRDRQIKELKYEKELADGCLMMIAGALEDVGCCHGHKVADTPPMNYDDMIRCAVSAREKQIERLQQENAALKDRLRQIKIALVRLIRATLATPPTGQPQSPADQANAGEGRDNQP